MNVGRSSGRDDRPTHLPAAARTLQAVLTLSLLLGGMAAAPLASAQAPDGCGGEVLDVTAKGDGLGDPGLWWLCTDGTLAGRFEPADPPTKVALGTGEGSFTAGTTFRQAVDPPTRVVRFPAADVERLRQDAPAPAGEALAVSIFRDEDFRPVGTFDLPVRAAAALPPGAGGEGIPILLLIAVGVAVLGVVTVAGSVFYLRRRELEWTTETRHDDVPGTDAPPDLGGFGTEHRGGWRGTPSAASPDAWSQDALRPLRCKVTVEGEPPGGPHVVDRLDLAYEGIGVTVVGPDEVQLPARRGPGLRPEAFTDRRGGYRIVDVRRAPGGNVELVTRRISQTLQVSVKGQRTGRGLRGAPVEVQAADGSLHSGRTDPQGMSEFELPHGPAEVRMPPVPGLVAEPVTVQVGGERRGHATLSVATRPPLLPDPKHLEVPLPGSYPRPPLLAQMVRDGLVAYIRVWSEVLADPQVHLDAPNLHVRAPAQVGQVVSRVRSTVAEVLREKPVQAHLVSRTPGGWSGTIKWARPRMLEDPRRLRAEVQQTRQQVDDLLTREARTLVIRPGMQLLQVADEFLAADARAGDLAALLGADLVVHLIQVSLMDPELRREWAKA